MVGRSWPHMCSDLPAEAKLSFMPELPEVETVVRAVRPRIVGREIVQIRQASPLMFESRVGPAKKSLVGKRIERLDRVGKFMFVRLSDGNTLLVHLGMTGRLAVVSENDELAPHTHFRLLLEGSPAEELRYADARRFGELCLLDPACLKMRFGKRGLGPDAVTIRTSHLVAIFSKTQRNVKSVLMDQRSLAGVGNIYADEALFAAGIHPNRRGCDLDVSAIARLSHSIRSVLKNSIARNGTTIHSYVTSEGVPGEFQNRLKVYGRNDEPCRKCKAPIQLDRNILSNRATCFCPMCQK